MSLGLGLGLLRVWVRVRGRARGGGRVSWAVQGHLQVVAHPGNHFFRHHMCVRLVRGRIWGQVRGLDPNPALNPTPAP